MIRVVNAFRSSLYETSHHVPAVAFNEFQPRPSGGPFDDDEDEDMDETRRSSIRKMKIEENKEEEMNNKSH